MTDFHDANSVQGGVFEVYVAKEDFKFNAAHFGSFSDFQLVRKFPKSAPLCNVPLAVSQTSWQCVSTGTESVYMATTTLWVCGCLGGTSVPMAMWCVPCPLTKPQLIRASSAGRDIGENRLEYTSLNIYKDLNRSLYRSFRCSRTHTPSFCL